MAQRYAPRKTRQGTVLTPAVGFQRAEQGNGVGFQVVNRAGPRKFSGRVIIQTVK